MYKMTSMTQVKQANKMLKRFIAGEQYDFGLVQRQINIIKAGVGLFYKDSPTQGGYAEVIREAEEKLQDLTSPPVAPPPVPSPPGTSPPDAPPPVTHTFLNSPSINSMIDNIYRKIKSTGTKKELMTLGERILHFRISLVTDQENLNIFIDNATRAFETTITKAEINQGGGTSKRPKKTKRRKKVKKTKRRKRTKSRR